MLTSKQRSYLKSLSNGLSSIFQIGKNGITPELTNSIDEALEARELIKLTVLSNCENDIKDLAEIIHERTHSEVVQVIGRKIVLFRVSKKKPTIELSKIK